jgi:predicted anti-sigma-YlaC factor YlaD
MERLHMWSLTRRHPRREVLSQYLDGELDSDDLRALEAHLQGCGRCRRLRDSLAETIGSLGSLRQETTTSVADTIIDALRAEGPARRGAQEPAAGEADLRVLALVPEHGPPPGFERACDYRSRLRAGVRYCLQRRQLRLTLPLALLAGVALSVINQGAMLFEGQVDVGMCAMCAMNFIVPFIALNLALLMSVRFARRGTR